MAAALKQRFGRFFPACETKTLFINSEDDRDEMNRRRAAARRAMRITPSSLAARLHIAADDDAPKIIRIEPRHKRGRSIPAL
jgi:RecA-family ATPase